MKYSGDDLAIWVMEEDMQGDLLTAIMNNDDYKVLPVKGKVKEVEGKFFFEFDKIGIDFDDYEMADVSREHAELMMHNKKYVSACIMLHDELVEVIIDYYEGNEEQRERSLWLRVFANMFQTLGLDTKGKVKKFIGRGLMNQAKYNEMDWVRVNL